MNDLQDKLDQHGPPDFGRAALWDRIERPRRRRRWLFFWWGLGIAALLVGACLWNGDWLYEKGLKSLPPALPEKTEQIPALPAKPQATEIKAEEAGRMKPKTATKRGGPKADATVIPLPSNGIPHDEWTGRQGYLRAPDGPSAQNRLEQPLEIFFDQRTITNASALPLVPLSPFAGLPEPLVSTTKGSPANKGATAAKPIEQLSSLPLTPLDDGQRSLDASIAEEPAGSAIKQNEFAVTFAAAGQWHLVDDQQCARRKEKPALPGYFLGARYKRKLTKGLYLLAGLTYSYNQSKITASTTESRQFYNELAEKSILRTTTFYELYNQYHRLDFAIGAGRSWQLRDFELSLEGSLGAAHWLRIDGDYLDDGMGVQPLAGAGAVQPTPFGSVRGELSRALLHGFRLGLNISGHTPIRVSPKGEGCRRQVLPVYLGMSMGKRF